MATSDEGPAAHPPSRRMSRLRAEKLVFQAFHIPSLHRLDASAMPLLITTPSAQSRPRLLSRASSRGSVNTFSPDMYLHQSGVQFFIEDLLKRLQDQRPEQPAAFIAAYFTSVAKGTHVSGRAFEFINGTMQNRVAFLSLLQKTFASVDQSMRTLKVTPKGNWEKTLTCVHVDGRTGDAELTLDDFSELIQCQCRDFPTQMLQQSAHHLKESDDSNHTRATLRAFLTAFSACFFYNGGPRWTALRVLVVLLADKRDYLTDVPRIIRVPRARVRHLRRDANCKGFARRVTSQQHALRKVTPSSADVAAALVLQLDSSIGCLFDDAQHRERYGSRPHHRAAASCRPANQVS